MSDDLLRKLKEQHHNTTVLDGDLMRDAAAEITRLRERLAEADECNRRVSDQNKELRDALATERERCAKIAENIYYPNEGKLIASAIREGGE